MEEVQVRRWKTERKRERKSWRRRNDSARPLQGGLFGACRLGCGRVARKESIFYLYTCYAAVLPSGTKTFYQERTKKAISVSCDLVCGLLAQARHLSVLWFPYFDPAGELKVAAKFDLTHFRFF